MVTVSEIYSIRMTVSIICYFKKIEIEREKRRIEKEVQIERERKRARERDGERIKKIYL